MFLDEPLVLSTLRLEHQALRDLLSRLEAADAALQRCGRDGFDERLLEVLLQAHLLAKTERHDRREEQVLLPALCAAGAVRVALEVAHEHAEAARLLRRLRWLAAATEPLCAAVDPWREREERRRQVTETVRALGCSMREHLRREEEEVFPLALDLLPPSAWERLQGECDAIGYDRRAAAGSSHACYGGEARLHEGMTPAPSA